MKILLFVFTFLTVFKAYENVSVFEKTFKMLHQEPPPPKSQSRKIVKTDWIEQNLDHFDSQNEQKWEMRYMENSEHFQAGGPIFIFVGGEWEITPGFISSGHFYDMAKEKKGMLYYTEHRYYGQSHPTDDLSVKNLKFLSVKQALADLQHFIKTMKKNKDLANSKVILAGGSYSATMVTWFRKLYPDDATGAWASSAPLFAKVNFEEYKEVAGQSIQTMGGRKCYDRINNGIKDLENLIKENRIAEIKALLKLCDNFQSKNELDVWSLFSTVSDIFAGLVQSSNAGDIERACNQIMKENNDLIGVSKWFLSRLGGAGCYDVTYKDSINSLSYEKWNNNIYRQWIYQTCNEFGWYQTSTSMNQPFGRTFPVELYTNMCRDVYNISTETLYDNVKNTNLEFGGWNPDVENVFMTHGSLDPWHAMGLLENEDGENNVIPFYAHCKDFGSILSTDSEEMNASKEKLRETVFKWLA